MDMDTDEQPEWARLIDERRATIRPKLSMRKAAELSGLSEGRWRQIIKGYQSTSGGKIPVIGPPETVARMAVVVGVTADELARTGRPDAAAELQAELDRFPDNPRWAARAMDVQAIWAELKAWMEAGDDAPWPGGYPPTSALVFWSSKQMLEALQLREQAQEKAELASTRAILERNATIDALRKKLGWPPILDNLSGSDLYRPIEEAMSAPDDSVHLAVAADDQETPIAGEHGESDTP